MEKPKLLVIGAGVNGSAICSNLFNAGVDVRILARGKRFYEISTEGIIIENPFNHKRTITHVPVINLLAPDDIYDFVLVVVRKNQALELLPLLAENRSPCFVFMGNNLLGPAEFIKALSKERVMMAGVFAAGKRDGSLIRAMVIKSVASPLGELDGTITPRLELLAETIRQGGFKVEFSRNIVDTQLTHGVGVAIIAALVLKHGGKIRQLASSSEDLKLYVSARREGLRLIRGLGHEILPRTETVTTNFPSFLQVIFTRWLLNSHFGEVGLQYHISQAPDEIQQMISELSQLVDQSGLALPAIHTVLSYVENKADIKTELIGTAEKITADER